MSPAYCDWNATAPPRAEALAAYQQAQQEAWGNPGALHRWGQQARHRLDEARRAIATLLGVPVTDLVITSGGTEANATAIAAWAGADATTAGGGAPVVVSAVEHSSVLRPAEAAARALGVAPAIVGVDGDGVVQAAALEAVLGPATRLVCLQVANNELGTIQPLARLVPLVRAQAPHARILADACQVVGKMALPPLPALGVDGVTFAGHKFGAPKGVGLLCCAGGRLGEPLLRGGRQQGDRRSGTEDAAGAAALAAALRATLAQPAAERERLRGLVEDVWTSIHAALPEAVWLGQGAPRLVNTLMLAHPGVERTALVTRMDLEGVAVSPGAACMASRGDPSHVVAALGLPPTLAASAIRCSFGWSSTAAEADACAAAYIRAVRSLLQR